MDYVINGLFFVAGTLVSYILFSRTTFMGKFEKMIWTGLAEGKRVIVSLDHEAYIFELFGNRVRVTQGIVDMMEELPTGEVNQKEIEAVAERMD